MYVVVGVYACVVWVRQCKFSRCLSFTYFAHLVVLNHRCLGMFAQGDACIRARFREYVCFCECVYTRM